MNHIIHDSSVISNVAQSHHPTFEVGDEVQLDTGEDAVIAAIYRDFAWVFSDIDGFETYELSELKRPDPSRRTLG
jgi:NADPH-dependent curcumin reductase CurA